MILNENGLSELDAAANEQRNSFVTPPIDVAYVEAYQTFVVMTKDSLRIYSGKTGRLTMYLDNIAGDNNKQGFSDLSSMTLDAKSRKIYLGDIDGITRCFNVSTGLCIKKIFPTREMLRKVGEATNKINREVISLKYFSMSEQNCYLISGHWNSRIRVWDEAQGEEQVHMRTASGYESFKEDI